MTQEYKETCFKLYNAILKNDYAHVKALVEKSDADVNAKDKNNTTVLMLACAHGFKKIAHYLITKGADINAKNLKNQTAYSLAKDHCYNDIVEMLKFNGAIIPFDISSILA
jgi:ankyrin repeat protein